MYNGSRRNDSPGPRQGYDEQNSRSRPRYESPGPTRDCDQRFGQNYQPFDHAMTIGPRSTMGHRHQETSAWSTTTAVEINHITAHRRPLNGEMAHYQEMVHSGTSRDLSPYHQGWDDVNEVVGFVVRWDVIP